MGDRGGSEVTREERRALQKKARESKKGRRFHEVPKGKRLVSRKRKQPPPEQQ